MTAASLRTDPAAEAFERAARRFVSLAKEPPSDGQRYAEELFRATFGLLKAVHFLPDVPSDDAFDSLGLEVDDEEWRRVFDGCSLLPGERCYDFVWPDGDPSKGDIADDVADTYRDLKPGLDAWDMKRDELLAGAVWLWKHTHRLHWGLHLEGLRKALLPVVQKRDWADVELAAGEKAFIGELLERHPEWSANITIVPSEERDTWTASVEVPSSTGDNSRRVVLWLDEQDPSVEFGNNWHGHMHSMAEFWCYVEAILNDELVIVVDVGGEHDGFETVVDLRDEDALLDHVTSVHSAPRTRIKSFCGTRDGECP